MIELFDNISLRALQLEDAEDIYNTIDSQREHLSRWLPFVTFTTSLEFTKGFVESVVNLPIESSEPTFTIRKGDEFIGLIGFKTTDRDNHKTEIGYWLSESEQGKGVITRAVTTLCKYAFDEISMNRVQIKCAVGNTPSCNIPKRLGFTFEGIERAGEQFPDGSFKDLEIYSFLKNDFLQNKEASN